MHFDTRAIRAVHPANDPNGAVVPPIYLATTFERDAQYQTTGSHLYTRAGNPNRDALERALATLESGAVGVAFGSGQAATMTLFQSLRPGDHVVVARDAYFSTPLLLEQVFHPWGLTYTRVDLTDLDALQAALHDNTRVVWCETPSNPLLTVTDILTIARLAHEAGAVLVCDNTTATPLLQNPLMLGADVVMHSTTKYLGGHSDVLGGVLIFRDAEHELARRVRQLQGLGGAVPSPFDCWLVLRGLKTLGVRMRAQMATAQVVAEFLEGHPAVEAVQYPGLASHPQRALVRQQMNGPGALLSFQVRAAQDLDGSGAAIHVCQRVNLLVRSTSLGGLETLIEHRATIEGIHSVAPLNLLRLSVGLEHPDDLIADLDQALKGLTN